MSTRQQILNHISILISSMIITTIVFASCIVPPRDNVSDMWGDNYPLNPPFVDPPSLPLNLVPGWNGNVLIDCESLDNWSCEYDTGSSGNISSVSGFKDYGIQLNWDMGTGNWVQAEYTFPAPIDLSQKDIFGITLKGSDGESNSFTIMFADTSDVYYGISNINGINKITRWMINVPIPKRMFNYFWGPRTEINWSQINRFFVVIKRQSPDGGGSGNLVFDDIQTDNASNWPREQSFTTITKNSSAIKWAVKYIKDQQESSGLIVSWKEEPDPKSWLYDQALALIVLTNEGTWKTNGANNDTAERADKLANFIISEQKEDGHWPRCWNPITGEELQDDTWVGDQAWSVISLMKYYSKSSNLNALSAVNNCADWLALQIDADGKIVSSTEGNLDAWFAMKAAGRDSEASEIKYYLLNNMWDDELQYFWRGYNDPGIALDAATWGCVFLKRNAENEKGLAALSLIRKALITMDNNGVLAGLDGMGPVSLWNDGLGQYISAGGKDSNYFLDVLLSQQRSDGGMPGSPDNWEGTDFGWLSSWTGLEPTCWFYFSMTGSPLE